MRNYIGSQQQWEDSVDADYDQREAYDKQQEQDNSEQYDDREPLPDKPTELREEEKE